MRIGMFDWLFGKKVTEPQPTGTQYKLISDVGGGFYSFGDNLYESDIVRSCIRPKARAVGKLFAKHIIDSDNFKEFPDDEIKLLLSEPNPLMSAQMFQEKMVNQLELNNNAFALIKRDDNYNPIEIYPVPAINAEMLEGVSGDLYLKFTFKDGKHMIVPYVDVIHLRQDYNEHQLFGDSPQEALAELMEVVTTMDQGMKKAIKNSAVVKWIMKFTSVLKPEDIQLQVDEFTKNYLSIENEGGAAASDPRYDLEQVKNDSYVPDSKQSKGTVERIYNFFGVNEKIIRSEYNEDEWNAYYESIIEPVAMQFSHEFTRKLFSRNERKKGHKIVFESTSLQYASMRTKLELHQMVDRGGMTANEWRRILNLGPIEGGDEVIRRLDTAEITKGGEDE